MKFILDPSLMFYLPLSLPDGGSLVSRDARGRLCTVAGAPWRQDGRYFDGADDKIDGGTAVAGLAAFSMEAWFQLASTFDSGASVHMSLLSSIAQPSPLMYLNESDGKLWFQVYPKITGEYIVKTTKNSWGGGQWYHALGTDDGAVKRIYVNGVQQNSAAGDHSPIAADNFEIGERGGLYDFAGIIGEVRVYSRALTSPEVQHNYLATKWRYQ